MRMESLRIIIICVCLLTVFHGCCLGGDHGHHDDSHHDNHGHHDASGHDNHGHHHGDEEHHDHDESDLGNREKLSQAEQIEHEKKHFLKLLFQKYGHDGRIDFEGFEHLLESLGLAQVKIADHDIHDHHTRQGFRKLHKSHHHFKNKTEKSRKKWKKKKNHGKWPKDLLLTISDAIEPSSDGTVQNERVAEKRPHLRHQGKKKGRKQRVKAGDRFKRALIAEDPSQSHDHSTDSTCMTPAQLFMAYQFKYENGLTESDFLSICPAMVYQLDIRVCNKRRNKDCFHEKEHLYRYHLNEGNGTAGGNDGHHHGHGKHGHGHSHFMEPTWELHEIPGHIWGFACLSITIISLVGLGGVAVVPIMQKVFYNHLIQFLVALAVGSLTGDALLHLLPHSILSVETGHDTSDLEAEAAEKNSVYKGLVALGGIYFFFIAERVMAIISEKKKQRKRKRRRSIREKVVGQKLSDYADNSLKKSCEDIVMVLNPNKPEMQDALAVVVDEHRRASAKSLTLDVPNHHGSNSQHASQQSLKSYEDHVDSGEDEEQQKKGHGHSHGDGKPPTSIASVAWMVILGDGLHNFSDGLAIGAAFANSLTGGLSTSIAVFCHELPHELGDFAVLLKAGMTAKQALFYNILSSVLAFLGMLIGVCVGNISSASFWIFAMTAGMFLYIALVDMLPEISTVDTKPGESAVCHLFLHLGGITVGLGIMLVIALFEDSIRINMSDSDSAHNMNTTVAP